MKYIINKGTETFEKLTALHQKMNDCEAAAHALMIELGGTKRLVYRTVAGGMHGIGLRGKPDGWRHATRDKWDGMYYPKKNKANKALIERIEGLPTVGNEDINAIVGFEYQSSGFTWFNRPAIVWGKEFCLMDVDDECYFTPNQDMKEILSSEYKKFLVILQKEHKKDEN